MTRRGALGRAAALGATLAVGGALPGCGDSSPQTGIVVEITSDLAVPDELPAVRVMIMNETGATLYDHPFNLGPTGLINTLPLRVGVQPQGGANAPIRILAVGHRSAQVIVSRSATLQFVSGRVLLLRLPLLATCQNVSCPNPTDTCRENGTCGSDVVDPTSLPDYHPGSDAAAPPDARDGGTGAGGTGGGGGTTGGGGASGTTGGAGAGGTSAIGGRGGAGGTSGGGTGGTGGVAGSSGRGGTGGGGTGGSVGGTGGAAGSSGRGGTGGTGGGAGGTGGVAGTSGRGGTGGGTGGTGGTGGGAGGGTVTTLNDGLIGYWAFDQAGNPYPDYSGNHNNASAPAGTWTAAGEVGGALDLTSASYFAAGAPGSASVNTITSQVSIAAWIMPLAAGAVHTIMSRVINIGYWKLTLNITGALSFTAGTRVVASPGMPGDGTKWVHVAASYDGATARVYINGAQVALATFGAISLLGGPVDGGAGGYGPDIGGTYDGTNAFDVDIYYGQMDEIVLYNRALTAAEADALARGALPARR